MNQGVSNLIGWYSVVIVAALIALATNAIVTTVGGGRGSNWHSGSKPAGITQIYADTYLLPASTSLTATDICKGGKRSGDVFRTRYIGEIRQTYVACTAQQYWNYARKRIPNFGDSLILTLKHPAWWIPTGSLLFFCTLYAFIVLARIIKSNRKTKMTLQQSRRELTAAWVRDEIEDVDYYLKMDKLYAQGLKPED